MSSWLSEKKVLVVDDEPDLCVALEYEFKKLGAIVFKAYGALPALALLDEHHFDVVVSDMRMPDGNGIQVLERVKQAKAPRPVFVLLSGFSDLTDSEAYQLGADVVSAKPFPRKELIEKIRLSHSVRFPAS